MYFVEYKIGIFLFLLIFLCNVFDNKLIFQMDEVLVLVVEIIKNFVVIYFVDIIEVFDFNIMYEFYDSFTIMFFFRNKYIMIDFGIGNNNKINWVFKDKQEFIDIVEIVYRGVRKGRGFVIVFKDYLIKYRY